MTYSPRGRDSGTRPKTRLELIVLLLVGTLVQDLRKELVLNSTEILSGCVLLGVGTLVASNLVPDIRQFYYFVHMYRTVYTV